MTRGTGTSGEGARTIDAGGYAVEIGRGIRHQFAAQVAAVARAHRYAVVSDTSVAPLYADALMEQLSAYGATWPARSARFQASAVD